MAVPWPWVAWDGWEEWAAARQPPRQPDLRSHCRTQDTGVGAANGAANAWSGGGAAVGLFCAVCVSRSPIASRGTAAVLPRTECVVTQTPTTLALALTAREPESFLSPLASRHPIILVSSRIQEGSPLPSRRWRSSYAPSTQMGLGCRFVCLIVLQCVVQSKQTCRKRRRERLKRHQ